MTEEGGNKAATSLTFPPMPFVHPSAFIRHPSEQPLGAVANNRNRSGRPGKRKSPGTAWVPGLAVSRCRRRSTAARIPRVPRRRAKKVPVTERVQGGVHGETRCAGTKGNRGQIRAAVPCKLGGCA